jgi:predicted dehydrogenase
MEQTRRNFIKSAAVASALGTSWKTSVLGANDKIVLAVIGGRNRGRDIAVGSVRSGAEIKTVCDIDDAVIEKLSDEVAKEQGKRPSPAKDFRTVLDDQDVDGVIIGTPDHWHAIQTILACQAGKDIYVEKPLSQTIEEGQLMRDAARKTGRIVQVGTQRRSGEHFRSAVEYVASGRLGKICAIKAWMCQVRKSIGTPADGPVPAGVDYDAWLGPAPKRAFNSNRFHYNWRFFWDYGNSELGNQGVHMLDVAMWAIQQLKGVENCLPRRVGGHAAIYWLNDAKEVPDTQTLAYDFEDFMLVWELHSFQRNLPMEGRQGATAFYGTEGSLIVDHRGWEVHSNDKEEVLKVQSSGGSHVDNFLDCMRTRKKPNADIELGRLSTTICHLGNIAYHLGRGLEFDPKSETFPNDAEANAFLTKEYRSPYTLPGI